jgi:hypothetical protein
VTSNGDGAVSVADRLVESLSPFLGPFNARVAVRTFAKKTLSLAPDDLKAEHIPQLMDALQPMLCTLAGRAAAVALGEEIRRRFL